MINPLSVRLAQARAMAPGLSAKELGRLAGVASTLPTMIERGKPTAPRIDTITKLAKPLGVSAAWLAFGEGPGPEAEAVKAAVEVARGLTANDNDHSPTIPPAAPAQAVCATRAA